MIQKKICMLGAIAVGKTSLVRRYVDSIFSEKYQTTVGVKIDKKIIEVNGQDLVALLWDLNGSDEFTEISPAHLRGASGYLLVVDPLRPATLNVAYGIQRMVIEQVGDIPFVVALNKNDLFSRWKLDDESFGEMHRQGWPVVQTSAKSGDAVEMLFTRLAEQMIARN